MKKILNQLNLLYETINTKLPFGYSLFPRNITYELLYGCNLNCRMCYLRLEEVKRKIKPRKVLGEKEIKTVISKIPSITSISFTGGEPFLRKDIFPILEYAVQRHRVGIISNLVLLNEDKIKRILDLGINALMFSLDGDKKIHDYVRGKGNFDKTVANVKMLCKLKKSRNLSKPIVTLNCVIQPSTYKVLDKVAKTAAEIGVNICNYQLLDESIDRSGYDLKDSLSHLGSDLIYKTPEIDPQNLVQKLNSARKILGKNRIKMTFSPDFSIKQITDYYCRKISLNQAYCFEPFYSTRISPFGDVYPCFNLNLGNLLKDDLGKIWNSQKYRSLRKAIREGNFLNSCVGCCHLKLKKI